MKSSGKIIGQDFYSRPDVVQISKDLLGTTLCTLFNDIRTSGIIIETEAYCGRNDKACHANNGTRTNRTEVMYGPPGHSYIYLCYGIHHLFNVVTNRSGLADAVLIRAVHPMDGIGMMKKRRSMGKTKNLCDGPGKLTEALGIDRSLSGCSLDGPSVWIEQSSLIYSHDSILSSPRIGVDYAREDALREWRFRLDPELFIDSW